MEKSTKKMECSLKNLLLEFKYEMKLFTYLDGEDCSKFLDIIKRAFYAGYELRAQQEIDDKWPDTHTD